MDKEAKPSEAIGCLEKLDDMFYMNGVREIASGVYEPHELSISETKEYDTIKQALLKAQELEKVLEIIKPQLRLVGNCLQARAPFVNESDDHWVFVKEITDEKELDTLKKNLIY